MPHILVKSHKPFKAVKNSKYSFEFCACCKNECKISINIKDKTFLLSKIQKQNNIYLIKIDKTTRISPLRIVKEAFNYYIDEFDCEVISSNIAYTPKDDNIQKKNYLKDISYFEHNFKQIAYKNVSIEIGFGSGKHILYQAKNNKDTLFIGVEIHTQSIDKLLRLIKVEGIENIIITNCDARELVQVLPSNCIENIFIHFPVPWDDSPHRRVISKMFLKHSNKILKPNGMIELRTDSNLYYEFSKQVFLDNKNFDSVIKTNNQIGVVSKYEQRWLNLNKNIYTIRAYKNKTSSKSKTKKYSFEFDMALPNHIGFDDFCDKLPKKAKVYKKDNIIVNFLKSYKIDAQNGIISCALGMPSLMSTKYLVMSYRAIGYYQSPLVNTKINHKAHKRLLCILKKTKGKFND